MFDIVQKNRTLVQVVLGLVSLGLVVGVGLTGYSAMSDDGAYLAKVKVYDEVEQVGEADHERFVIDLDKYMERLRKKIEA